MTEVALTAEQIGVLAYGLSMLANAAWFACGLLVFS